MNILIAAFLLAAPIAMAERTREVIHYDNVAVDLIAEGRGPLLVLLPSLGRDSEEFDPVAEMLAAGGLRVLRPQPRGYGRSAGPMKNITLHDYARDVAAVIEHENAGPAVVAGHAFGHFVAKMTAVDFPKLTRAVILIGAAQKTPDPQVQRAVAIATDPSQPEPARLGALRQVFFARGNDPRTWLTGFHADVRAAEIIARDSTPQKEYYSAGTVPLLDIQGSEDPYKPPSSSTELIDEFGANRVRVVRIANAAHAIIVEQPGAVADAILYWVRNLPRVRATVQ